MNLNCGQCIIRPWKRTDEASLVRFANNRKIWRNLTHSFFHPYTRSDAQAWFLTVEQQKPEPTRWAIEVNDVAVGGIGIDLGEGVYAKTGRFGYWIGEPFWGRGIMTAAVQATAAHILQRYDLIRLDAPVFEWNPASMRVLEKCGFVREGVLQKSVFKDGKIIDQVLYALIHSSRPLPPKDRLTVP